MPSTESQLQSIARTLSQVVTTGQARAAIGACLKAISPAFEVAEKIGDSRTRASLKGELETKRIALHDWYRTIPGRGDEDFRRDWQLGRHRVDAAYNVIAAIEGAAGYVPRTSNWEILSDAIAGAPAVFGQAVGTVAGEAGKASGQALGGLLAGLGVSGSLHLVVIGLVVAVVLTRGTIIGRAITLVKGILP